MICQRYTRLLQGSGQDNRVAISKIAKTLPMILVLNNTGASFCRNRNSSGRSDLAETIKIEQEEFMSLWMIML